MKLNHVLNILARDKCRIVSLVDTKLADPADFRHTLRRVLPGRGARRFRAPWFPRHALCPEGTNSSGVTLLLSRALEPHAM